MSDLPGVPDGWRLYLPILGSLARTILAVLGTYGCTWAVAVTADQVQMAIGAAMILASAGWSAWQKIAAQRALRTAAANPPGITPPKLPA